jgi:prevent-host-death family protein
VEKRIGIAKAREGLSDLINEVAYGGERYVVERRGKPLAALIGVDEYRQLTELLAEQGVQAEVRGVPVRIRYDGERYFVSDDRLDLYGAGATLDEAREDYALALEAYYADLSANADRLAPPLRAHLAYLRELLDREPA